MSDQIPLPNQGTMFEYAGIQYVLAKNSALELYNLIQASIEKYYGPIDWFAEANARLAAKKLKTAKSPLDIRFLLRETLEPESKVREVATWISPAWDSQAEKLAKLMNKWSHQQIDPKTTTFLDLLYPMLAVSSLCGMSLTGTVQALIERTKLIRDNAWQPTANDPVLPEQAVEVAKEIESKKNQIKKRPPVGGLWIGEKATRKAILNKATRDLTIGHKSIKDELKPDPEAKITEFLRFRPLGGELYIDDDGAVMAHIKGDKYLVGWMGDEPDVKPEDIRGFLDTRDYIFLGNDIKDAQTDLLLSEVATEPIDNLINGLNAWGGLTIGSILNVTEYGDLIFEDAAGESHKITKVHSGIWFVKTNEEPERTETAK